VAREIQQLIHLEYPIFCKFGWNKAIFLYLIDAKKRTQIASEKRIDTCLPKMLDNVEKKKIYLAVHYTLIEAENDISHVECIRRNEVFQPLPCFR
jgi:hypothetical protein